MTKLKIGDKVKWIKEMAIVPHPEGKTDRRGNVLSVLRDLEITGTLVDKGPGKTWQVRPSYGEANKNEICGERYFDIQLSEDDIILS